MLTNDKRNVFATRLVKTSAHNKSYKYCRQPSLGHACFVHTCTVLHGTANFPKGLQ